MNKKGFTLIELMVVISIIGVLSVVGLVLYSGAQNQARYAKVAADFNSMYVNISIARIYQHEVLGQITYPSSSMGHGWCSECTSTCRANPASAACLSYMKTAYSKITSAPLPIDPWGDPYMWDENEGDLDITGGPCISPDIIESAGPDRIWGVGSVHGADNIIYNIQRTGYTGCTI